MYFEIAQGPNCKTATTSSPTSSHWPAADRGPGRWGRQHPGRSPTRPRHGTERGGKGDRGVVLTGGGEGRERLESGQRRSSGWPAARLQRAAALWSSSDDGKRLSMFGSARGCSWWWRLAPGGPLAGESAEGNRRRRSTKRLGPAAQARAAEAAGARRAGGSGARPFYGVGARSPWRARQGGAVAAPWRPWPLAWLDGPRADVRLGQRRAEGRWVGPSGSAQIDR
jgi:hypothetical protein